MLPGVDCECCFAQFMACLSTEMETGNQEVFAGWKALSDIMSYGLSASTSKHGNFDSSVLKCKRSCNVRQHHGKGGEGSGFRGALFGSAKRPQSSMDSLAWPSCCLSSKATRLLGRGIGEARCEARPLQVTSRSTSTKREHLTRCASHAHLSLAAAATASSKAPPKS